MRAKSGAFGPVLLVGSEPARTGAVEGVRGSRARLRVESGAFGAVLLVGSEPASTVQQVGRMGAVARGDTKMKKTTTTRKQRKTHSEKMTDTSRDYRQTDGEK